MSQTEPVDYAPAAIETALGPGMGFRLSVMMFLQYAIWGIWAPILGLYLGALPGFQTAEGLADFGRIGLIYMTMPIASIIAPFVGGQIADRYFSAERFLAISQLLGGVVLLVVTQLTSFAGVFIGMLVYNLLYAPTIALTNSITFQHWPNQRFSRIRVFGSIGWIVIGWLFTLWMAKVGHAFRTPAMGDCLYGAAVLSIAYAVYSLFLPHTPPSKQAGNPLAFLDAVKMLRNPAFAVMAVVSFFVAIELQLYFVWAQSFLKTGVGIEEGWVSTVLTAGQVCEMVMMILLPLALLKFGFRATMALGIAAWCLRDLVFAIGQPTGLVVGAVGLHGVGYAFFFTTIFMFADAIAPKDIKSSAQGFLASVTIGCGMLVGSLLTGPISDACGNQWSKIFLVPAILCAVCCVVFLIGFRDTRDERTGAFPVTSKANGDQGNG
ncbi:MAG: MFS transporter [Sedimentisphaerales bacterium]|nr:MFS transporter [Sedimentisphaerales bacterium]